MDEVPAVDVAKFHVTFVIPVIVLDAPMPLAVVDVVTSTEFEPRSDTEAKKAAMLVEDAFASLKFKFTLLNVTGP